MGRVYANRDELVSYAPAGVVVPAEPEASRMLARASDEVELATMSAIYTTDAAGMPTDPTVVDAMREATCAQAVHWIETGDESGTAGQWASVGIGSINLARTANGAASTPAGHLPDTVARPLRLAGLLPGQIVHL
ncbi:hypothetical protein [Saccharopolyspora sp. NPDC002376]